MKNIEILQTGLNYLNQGKVEQAEHCFKTVLSKDGQNHHALNLLGMLFVNTDRAQQGQELIIKALTNNPNDAQAHANIALAYKDLKNHQKAEKHLKESVRINPNKPQVWNNLGNILREQGKLAEAVTALKRALTMAPDYAECLGNLSLTLCELGEFTSAFKVASKALKFDANIPQALCSIGEMFNQQGDTDKAISNFQKALDVDPNYVDAIIGIAVAYREAEQADSALEYIQKAKLIAPEYAKIYSVEGVIFEQLGEFEQAVSSFKKAIELSPNVSLTRYQLAKLRGYKSSDEELRSLEATQKENINKNPSEYDEKGYVHYALAVIYDERNNTDAAFLAWKVANEIRAKSSPYDSIKRKKLFELTIEKSKVLFGKQDVLPENVTPKMLFIVGLQRSGTSLTDQILTSHANIGSVGEVGYSESSAVKIKSLTGIHYPEGLPHLTKSHLTELRNDYLNQLPHDVKTNKFVIDKTPINLQYLGLLATMFPNAKFVHCHRDPIDNCFSIYKLPFSESQDYAHSLPALASHYTLCRYMMTQWETMYSSRIINVRYEDTVENIQTQCERLLSFLELDFDENMLSFYKSKRQVRTPSASQVRQPIYKTSVSAWKKYETHLQPLISGIPDDFF